MKNLIRTMCAVGVLAAAPALADVYVVEDAAGDMPIVIVKDDPELGNVPDIGGKPNSGFSYATRYVTAGTGLRVHRGHVEAGGYIAEHDGPNVYVLYVVNGTGALVNTGPDGAESSRIEYKPDDIIVFREGTMHYWENGDEAFDFVGFEQIPVGQ